VRGRATITNERATTRPRGAKAIATTTATSTATPALRALAALALAGALAAGIAVAACFPDIAVPDLLVEPSSVRQCGDDLVSVLPDGGGESCDPGEPGEAGVHGCVDCRIVCEGVLDEATGHCYFAASDAPLTAAEALTACEGANAHVVTPASHAETNILPALAYW
jgi:hypothetical protein